MCDVICVLNLLSRIVCGFICEFFNTRHNRRLLLFFDMQVLLATEAARKKLQAVPIGPQRPPWNSDFAPEPGKIMSKIFWSNAEF